MYHNTVHTKKYSVNEKYVGNVDQKSNPHNTQGIINISIYSL